ncbi:hypothetical protein [Microbacterium hydrocarbonoxydans]|uniref:hypothetical protein n=1 Tax=Microbacterium hydrocarbonoxydans TaxID=273678 RepID=UPI00203E7C10|nr:hypothetical protein [Microbacterium hydrocarbonoxydans]MCM3780801.1 hypothetical protein [Microbacterium hydrocarbonoxydans]
MDLVWIIGIVVAALIVVAVLSRAFRAMRPQAPAVSGSMAGGSSAPVSLSPDAAAEIDRLVAAEQKIQAIKVYRDHTDVSLREAKNAIDRWVVGSAPATTAIAVQRSAPTDAAALRSSLPASVASEIDRLVTAEQPIAAIKLLREHSGLGLRDSKDAIDAWPSAPSL